MSLSSLSKYSNVIPFALGTFIMVNGGTLLSIFIPIYLIDKGYGNYAISAVTASYYCGMVIGAVTIDKLLAYGNYLTVFVAAAIIASISSLLPYFYANIVILLITRFLQGACISGLYVIFESSILNMAGKNNKGTYLAFYTTAIALGAVTAPFLLNVGKKDSLGPEFIVAAVLFCAIPIISYLDSNHKTLQISEQSGVTLKQLFAISRIGVIGCVITGFIISSIISVLPAILVYSKFSEIEISKILSLSLFGNVVFQYPIGKISDRYENKKNIAIFLCLLGVVAFYAAIFSHITFGYRYCINVFLIGGAVSSLYPITVNLTCSALGQKDTVRAIQILSLLYALGAMLGPVLTIMSLERAGPPGFFIANGSLLLLFALYCFKNEEYSKPRKNNSAEGK